MLTDTVQVHSAVKQLSLQVKKASYIHNNHHTYANTFLTHTSIVIVTTLDGKMHSQQPTHAYIHTRQCTLIHHTYMLANHHNKLTFIHCFHLCHVPFGQIAIEEASEKEHCPKYEEGRRGGG
jgi:hypothetical protein